MAQFSRSPGVVIVVVVLPGALSSCCMNVLLTYYVRTNMASKVQKIRH
jgi:hypothetical protein